MELMHSGCGEGKGLEVSGGQSVGCAEGGALALVHCLKVPHPEH
jgi:hypothetical protein